MGPCQHKRRWPVGGPVEWYGGRRMMQDLWIRWRCSRCESHGCPPCAIEAGGIRPISASAMRRPAKGAAVRHVGRDGMGTYGHRTLVR